MAKTSARTRLPEGARRLRCTADNSDKFYDIILEDDSYTVHYGRWGSAGSFQTKEFPSARQAQEAYDKMIRSKIAKGYRDITNEADQNAATTRSQARNQVANTANVEEAMERTTSGRTKTSSGGKNVSSKKTPENQGRKRRKLID